MGNTVIQLRNDTAASWTSNNPTLAQGEMGLETDTNRFKFGDGSTAWNSLPYVGAGASFKYGLYTLSADQTSNTATGNHIEWNTSAGSLGGLSTGSGQANGIITLAGGKSYKMHGLFAAGYSASGTTHIRGYDRTNSAYITPLSAGHSMNLNYTDTCCPVFLGIISPASNIDIDFRFSYVAYTNKVYSCSWVLIEEYGGY